MAEYPPEYSFSTTHSQYSHPDEHTRWPRYDPAPISRSRTRQPGLRPPASLPRTSISSPISNDRTLPSTSANPEPFAKDIIRKNYYAARNCTAGSETDKHVVHCLDYIRQALQCHADTNLEFRVVAATGEAAFTGYGEHRCRDFERVVRFAEEWRVYDGKSDGERVRISREEMVHARVIHYDYVSSRGDAEPVVGAAS